MSTKMMPALEKGQAFADSLVWDDRNSEASDLGARASAREETRL